MTREVGVSSAATSPTEMLLTTNGAVRVTDNTIGIHPNVRRQTLHSEIRTDPRQALLYDTFFHVARSHDAGFSWAYCEPEQGVYVWDRMHEILDPLIAAGKKIIYVLTDMPYHAVCGNISQRWVANKAEVTGTGLSNMVFPTVANRTKYMYEVTTAGTSGTSEPVWPTTLGATVNAVGGTAVYTCRAIPSGSPYLNFGVGDTHLTTKAGDVSYAINASTMPSDRSIVMGFITALCTEFNGAIHSVEVGNEATFVMEDNLAGPINPSWVAFNLSDAETFVSIAYAVKDAIAALPANIKKPLIGGSGWVSNPSPTLNLKQFLEAKDPVTGKYGYEIDYDWHSLHIYGGVDVGKVGGTGYGWGLYTNLRNSIDSLRNVLTDYEVTDPKFRITEYGVNPNSTGRAEFNALSEPEQLTVIKMRMIHALTIPNCVGFDFYNWAAGYNTLFNVANSPIQQAMNWIKDIHTINWAKQNTTTGELTFNVTTTGQVGSSATQTLNYPANWPETLW